MSHEGSEQHPERGARRVRLLAAAVVVALGAAAGYGSSAIGGHSATDRHSKMTLVDNYNDGGSYRVGTDLAFWGKPD